MTGASKILTVSYGTFSCTLEGFDDPFNTMKAIAEYFRDLAAEDRYFGAEPPTPDAAMLHRIAEREIQRRVEAKIQDNGVILRAEETVPATAPLPVAEIAPPPKPAVAEVDSSAAESVAERLQRIRARHAAPPPAQTAAAPDSYIEDEHAEAPGPAQAPVAPVVVTPLAEIEIPDQIEQILDAAELKDTADSEAVTLAEPAEDTAPMAAAAPEDDRDVAVSVDQIVAIDAPKVAENVDQAADADSVAAVVEQPAGTADFSINLIESDDETALLARLSAPESAEEPVAAAAQALDEAALLARLSADVSPAGEEPVAETPAEAATDWDSRWDETELNLEELDFSQPEPAPAETVAQTETPTTDPVIEPIDQVEDTPEPQAEQPAPAPRARARVIRIRRADPAAAAAPAAAAPAPEAAPEPVPSASKALSDEEEAALQAELAALEAELAAPVAELADDVEVNDDAMLASLAEAPAEVPARTAAVTPRHPIDAPAEDDAVNRLMAQADSEMSGEDTRRRQSAIAHLKAAVAATVADRKVSTRPSGDREAQIDAYRNDLDRVVRPRRPAAEVQTPRPSLVAPGADAPQRPTPLVLVSAQRIDRPQPAAATEGAPRVVMPVRPRRPVAQPVAETAAQAVKPTAAMQEFDQSDLDGDDILDPSENGNVFADATSFQDFADQLGAQNLPDLLEAAAVYCAEVLQRPEFSRPLVMRQIAALPSQSDTAREDFLRGFGTLLRQGRITKVKRGMFALTDRSPYLAEARKLAG